MNFIESLFSKKTSMPEHEKNLQNFLKMLELNPFKRKKILKEIQFFSKENNSSVSYYTQAFTLMKANELKPREGHQLEQLFVVFLKLFVELSFDQISRIIKKSDLETHYQFNLFRSQNSKVKISTTPRVFDCVYEKNLDVINDEDKKIYHQLQVERKDLMRVLLQLSKSKTIGH